MAPLNRTNLHFRSTSKCVSTLKENRLILSALALRLDSCLHFTYHIKPTHARITFVLGTVHTTVFIVLRRNRSRFQPLRIICLSSSRYVVLGCLRLACSSSHKACFLNSTSHIRRRSWSSPSSVSSLLSVGFDSDNSSSPLNNNNKKYKMFWGHSFRR